MYKWLEFVKLDAMAEATREMLNRIYSPIIHKSHELHRTLIKQYTGSKINRGFFNGHYHKNSEGEYQPDMYPIPVISFIGLCDIEFDFDTVSITTKISRNQIQLFDWNIISSVHFEIYGVENYLKDYGSEQNYDKIGDNIASSTEKEFFVSIYFPFITSIEDLAKFLTILQKNNFYY